MKGIVFTEFIEFVEDRFGFEISEDMIMGANLKSDGIYTGIGTYPHSELVNMVIQLSKHTKIPISDLMTAYGQHLFTRFVLFYPQFFTKGIDIFNFIAKIDSYIHVEVQKLYPDAELPSVQVIDQSKDSIEIIYSSKRKFGDFAHGLLIGASDYFKENIEITKEDLVSDKSEIRFLLRRIL
jgi:hypothetical protein